MAIDVRLPKTKQTRPKPFNGLLISQLHSNELALALTPLYGSISARFRSLITKSPEEAPLVPNKSSSCVSRGNAFQVCHILGHACDLNIQNNDGILVRSRVTGADLRWENRTSKGSVGSMLLFHAASLPPTVRKSVRS